MVGDTESYAYFGDPDEDFSHTFDAQYERARLAFMFGKFEFSYGIWKEQAELGHADSQASLAWIYQTGNGTKKDLKAALYWYQQAAEQNHAIAQNNLGVLYEKGWGTARNLKAAAKWYRESAESGYSYGQYNLGQALLTGRGLARNRNEGIYWIELAALQGVTDAQQVLAKLTKQKSPSSHKAAAKPRQAETQEPDHAVTMRREGWVTAQDPRHYTIELLSASKEETILQYVFHNKLIGTLAYIKYSTAKDAKTRYSLLLGNYSNYQDANDALLDLPENVRTNKPFIRRFADLQALPAKKPDSASSRH